MLSQSLSKCLISSSRNQKKSQHTKRKYDENIKWIWIYQNENTVNDDPGNVESATDDSNNGNFIRTCKKIFGL